MVLRTALTPFGRCATHTTPHPINILCRNWTALGASAEQEAVSKAADAGSTPATPAIDWENELKQRDHLPEGSY